MQYTDIVAHIIDIAWIVFMAVWIVSAFTAKRMVRSSSSKWALYRIVMAVVIIFILSYFGSARSFIGLYIHNPTIRWIAAALVILGAIVGIWARFHLGRNWGMPMSEKEGAELITTGPYAYIRNPIYSGVLLAVLGSALAFGALWAVILVFYAAYFFFSVFAEEKIMARLFPDQYPAYKAGTKRLIPWVW